MKPVTISPLAQQHLRAISLYILEDNPPRALSFVQELRERCSNLSTFPTAGPVVRRFHDKDVRRIVHRRYNIFYLVGDVIEVIAIVSGTQDLDAILPQDTDDQQS